jgi:hypothetical protein
VLSLDAIHSLLQVTYTKKGSAAIKRRSEREKLTFINFNSLKFRNGKNKEKNDFK